MSAPDPDLLHNSAHGATVSAARELIETLCLADAPEPALLAAREKIEQAAALLRPHRRQGPYKQYRRLRHALARASEDGFDPGHTMPWSPVIGALNPVAPPLEFRADGSRLRGRGRVPLCYAGPPQAVHGGIVAAILDELMALVIMQRGVQAFTGTMTVRYHRTTPIDVPLDCSAEVEREDGRKLHARAEIRVGEQLTASALAVFLRPR